MLTVGRRTDRPPSHADGHAVGGGPRVDRLRLRGLFRSKLGLGWIASGCEGRGFGGKPEHEGQATRGYARLALVTKPTTLRRPSTGNQNVLGEPTAQQVSPRQPEGTQHDRLRGRGSHPERPERR
jgi:hypothetical protein